jgi:alkylhydroperoxidase/carboxymuconolactone decarboxylase family protein YurZ
MILEMERCLAVLRATDEPKLHVKAALNVGCEPREKTEIFFNRPPMRECLP